MRELIIELFDPQLAAQHSPELPDANCTHPGVERAWREKCIRDAAYFRSLRRAPCVGKELEDWLAAEREIDGPRAERQ
jgi:Protein of unknown function (DUF2934)